MSCTSAKAALAHQTTSRRSILPTLARLSTSLNQKHPFTTSVTPTALYAALPSTLRGSQHDPHEILLHIIAVNPSSSFTHAFTGATSTHRTWGQCATATITNDTLTVLNLPAFRQHDRNNSPTSLPRLLTNLASSQPLDCKVCHHPHATERTTVSTAPRCFVINLMRYKSTLVKSFRRITYPLSWAPLTQSLTHDLVGVVRHLGTSFHRGHYVAHVKESDGIWFMCDDSRITVTTELHALNPGQLNDCPCLLFYQMRNI